MKQSWIIGMLALINFLVGTSQFIIVGILDKIVASMGITIEMAGLVCFSLLQQVSYGAVGALLIWAMFAWVFGLAVGISHAINKNGIASLVGTKAPRVRYNTVFCLLVIIV